MSGKLQNNQLRLAFGEDTRSEAPQASGEGSETLTAKRISASPANHEQLMEEVCERVNCLWTFLTAGRYRHCCRTWCSTNLIGNWSGASTASCGTRTIATFAFAAGGQGRRGNPPPYADGAELVLKLSGFQG
jgi:hypothetical protein